MSEINKVIEELKDEANWFWSDDIIGEQQENSLISDLIETTKIVQNCVVNSTNNNIVNNLMNLRDDKGKSVPRFLVLKNLMILLDISAEILDRSVMYLHEKNIEKLTVDEKEYHFNKFGKDFKNQLSNNNIFKLCESSDDFFQDVLFLILYASGSEELKMFNTFNSFRLGLLSGDEDVLNEFLARRSIENSSQIKQLRAVAYGNGLQREAKNKIISELSDLGVQVASDGRYLGIQQFDIVLYKHSEPLTVPLPTAQSVFDKKKLNKEENLQLLESRAEIMKQWKWAVIEVSFQETTNSTMERKSKQASNGLFADVDADGHQLIYLIDGAGYFRRPKVIETLFNNSHKISTLSPEGVRNVIEHLKEYFK